MSTIKDVARLAGVGVGTASRVVSGRGSVAAATAQRVRQAIEQLDFKPSHAARSLLSGSSQMIGVYIPILKGTFYTPILSAIDTELRLTGRHMVVAFGCGDGNARQQAVEGIDFLLERGCDGLIVMSNALMEDDLTALGAKQKNIVMLNHFFPSMAQQCFTADHLRGGVLAAKALIERGHRHIAIISGSADAPDNAARMDGFLSEMKKNNISQNKIVMEHSDFSPEGGFAAAQKILASGHRFTALFCANDEMAVGALAYFQQSGISVPSQISVMGYDDTHSAAYSAPQLTSVHIPWREITTNALRCLLNQCYGQAQPVQKSFPVSVTWRSSVLQLEPQLKSLE